MGDEAVARRGARAVRGRARAGRSATAGCPSVSRRAGQLSAARSGLVVGRFRSPGQELRQLRHVLHLLQQIVHFRAQYDALLEPALDLPVQRGGRFFFQVLRNPGLKLRLVVKQRAPQSGDPAGVPDGKPVSRVRRSHPTAVHRQDGAAVFDACALSPLRDLVLVAAGSGRLPGGHLVGGHRHRDQPPQRFAPLQAEEPDPLAGFELRARRDQAVVRRPDAGRDHRVAVKQHIERLRVVQIHGRRPRSVLLFAFRPLGLGGGLRYRPHRQLDARAEPRQRAGRFRAAGLDVNVPRRTDLELETEGAADLLDAAEAGDVPAISVQVERDGNIGLAFKSDKWPEGNRYGCSNPDSAKRVAYALLLTADGIEP